MDLAMLFLLVLASSTRLAAFRTPPALMLCSRSARSGLNPRALNQRIVKLTDPLEVLRLHDEYGHAYDEINLSTTWSRLGRAHGKSRSLILFQDGKCLHVLRERSMQEAEGWQARSLANTAHALAKLQLRSGGWRALWDVLAAASHRKLAECGPQALASIAWAFAKVGHAAPALLDAIAAEAAPRVGEFDPQALANTAWAFAKVGHAAPALLDAIAAEAALRMGDFNSQEFSNLAWAFATAGHKAPALLDAIAAEAAPRVGEFRPQTLANTAWAFAKARHAAPALLDAIGAEAAPRLGEFTSQELVNTAWAFATARHAAPALLDAIAAEAALRVGDFKPQALAITAWAFATAGHAAPALLDAIAAEAAPRVSSFDKQALANTAWAFATAGHAAPALFDSIAAEAAPRLGEFDPQGIANTAWAFATAGHAAPALLDAIAAEAAPRVGEFRPQALVNTAWAFATAGHAASSLFDAIAVEAAPRVGEFNPQVLANMAWSFAVAATLSSAALVHFFGHDFGSRCDVLAGSSSHEDLSQLHQWWLWYASERGQTTELLSQELLQRCRGAFSAMEARPSNLQRQVGSTLSSLGLDPQEEVRTEAGYSLDYVVEWRGRQVAIEVDGPSHFLGRKPTGTTMLKRQQLRHLGWRLVSIPYWGWNELAEAPITQNKAKIRKSGTPGPRAAVMALRERQRAYIENAIALSATAT
jgi:nicotinamide riboside kinase